MLAYLETAPPDYNHLKRKQLADSQHIQDVEEDLCLMEDAMVEQSGGGVCLSTDGGKSGLKNWTADDVLKEE